MPRLIGVPASSSSEGTIFDRPPENKDPSSIRKWERKQFRRLHKRVKKYRGAAMNAYITHLIKRRDQLQCQIAELMSLFENKVRWDDMTIVHEQISSNFAVMFAGAMLAVEAGLLPFTEQEVGRSIKKCFQDAIGTLSDPRAKLHSGLQSLSEHLQSSSVIRVADGEETKRLDLAGAAGWCKRTERSDTFVVRAREFSRWLNEPAERKLVLDWLDKKGFLNRQKRSDHVRGAAIEWAERQTTWPDNSRPRSIVLVLPRGVTDLETS